VSFVLEACAPPAGVSEMLAMPAGEPCLVLRRQTRSMGSVASMAALWHPASRYQFTGSF
jgi:GntR family histidine utilization transcriptional repressor